jgi:endo-1,4-beta-xylanase
MRTVISVISAILLCYAITSAAPTNNAPTPTVTSTAVLSLYNSSGIFSSHPGINWNSLWGVGAASDFKIANTGRTVKKYTNLQYIAAEFYAPNLINASSYNTLHVDVWTHNANQFGVKLISTNSPDGAQIDYLPSSGFITSNSWISLDMPLSWFVSQNSSLNLSCLQELLWLDNQPGGGVTKGDFYIDNVYFYSKQAVYTNLLVNPGFESGINGWFPYPYGYDSAYGVIAATSDLGSTNVHSGSNAVYVSRRAFPYEGVGQSLLDTIMPFKTYGISAWVCIEGVSNQPVQLTMREISVAGGTTWSLITKGTNSSTRWYQLAGTYMLTHSVGDLTLYLEGPAPGVNFYADDFVVTPCDAFDWKGTANANIEQYRRRDAVLHLVDAAGNPMKNTAVTIRQTRADFAFGSAINMNIANPQYGSFFRSNFEWAVMENESKWMNNEPTKGAVTYADADLITQFCNSNNIAMRGHCLFWGVSNHVQPWVINLPANALSNALNSRLTSAVPHFKGIFKHWDVNNEMLHGDYFSSQLGAGVDSWMFKTAHDLDPGAKLFVNDYDVINGDKVEDYKDQISGLTNAGAPVSALGVQGHFGPTVDPWLLNTRLDNLAGAGLPIWITEYDSNNTNGAAVANNLEILYRTAFGKPSVEGILMWGFWAGSHYPDSNGTIVNLDWKLNEAGLRYQALRAEWTTVITNLVSDAKGVVNFRGFHGDYNVEIPNANDISMTNQFKLQPGSGAASLTVAPTIIYVSAIAISKTNLIISWPSNLNLILESATNLTSPIRWTPVSNFVRRTNDQFIEAIVPIDNMNRYFRLN